MKKLSRLSQRAAKQMIGYFIGYICKRQPAGRYELKVSTQNLPLMKTKLERWSPSHQLAQITNRIFADLEGKGTLRSAPGGIQLGSAQRREGRAASGVHPDVPQ